VKTKDRGRGHSNGQLYREMETMGADETKEHWWLCWKTK